MKIMEKIQKIRHFPVLLKEFLEVFNDDKIDIFLDGTLGLAGHAKALLEEHKEIDIFIGLDQDKDALDIANDNLKPYMGKVRLVHENFEKANKVLDDMNIKYVDGIFFDLGVSSMQLDVGKRGFSFRFDSDLDMRMNQNNKLDAKKVINEFSERDLERIFREYGEEKRSKIVAREIVNKRKKKPINTTFELLEILKPILPKSGKIHPATLIFQAIRICVNDELNSLKTGLDRAIDFLKVGSKIAIISFHSLEDRIVKHTFKENKKVEILTKKPITSSYKEKNKRARSAKMRVAKKIELN